MSKCISRHGEYSDHKDVADFTCGRCYAFDEDAARAEVAELHHLLHEASEVARERGEQIARWEDSSRNAAVMAKQASDD